MSKQFTIYLDWREVRHVELLGHDEGAIRGELPAGARRRDASPDPVPPLGIIGDVASQPGGVALEAVVVVGPAKDRVRAVAVRDGEGEDEERQEQRDERRHREEVAGQQAPAVPVRAREARQRDEEEQRAQDRQGPAEQPEAVLPAVPRGEPEPCCGDGDGAEEDQEVDARRDVVVHRHDGRNGGYWDWEGGRGTARRMQLLEQEGESVTELGFSSFFCWVSATR